MTDLPSKVLKSIWENDLLPGEFDGARRSDRPLLVFVGGQPGAGKTQAHGYVQSLYPEIGFTKIIGDDYRAYHPDYVRTLRTDPLQMPNVTAQAAGSWVAMAIEHGLQHKYSLAVEGTWRNPDVPLATLKDALQAGFGVHAVILGVPQEHSRLGCMVRYYFDLADGRPARWTPPAIHDEAYDKCPSTFAALIRATGVDQTLVFNREGLVVHRREWSSDDPTVADEAVSAVIGLREAIWPKGDIETWLRLLDRARPFRPRTQLDVDAEMAWRRIEDQDLPRVRSMGGMDYGVR